MSDILTACLATDAALVEQFLVGQGQSYVATYGPFNDDILSVSRWVPPEVTLIGGVNQAGAKVLVHTRV